MFEKRNRIKIHLLVLLLLTAAMVFSCKKDYVVFKPVVFDGDQFVVDTSFVMTRKFYSNLEIVLKHNEDYVVDSSGVVYVSGKLNREMIYVYTYEAENDSIVNEIKSLEN